MNLRQIANSATRSVNPNIPITILPSNGYTIAAGGKQIPAYAPEITTQGQVQQLTAADLRKLDGMNIQGAVYAVFLNGQWDGVIRANQQGGDVMKFKGQTWLVTAVLEQWPDWTKVAVTLQNKSGADHG